MTTIQASVELFHLLFLCQLEGKLDKKLYALKGGCNLRFFFKSIRYSEDIDFDVNVIAKSTLENKINKILNGSVFKKILQGNGIEIIQVASLKQTETTQRWKVLLQIKDRVIPIPTKIEFSRRTMDRGVEYVAIDADIIRQYKLYPILCNHYQLNTAFLQKVSALINRTETQARDIFDLSLLLDQGASANLNSFSFDEIQIAIANALSISYVDFKGQVTAYLMDEYQSFYDSLDKWESIRSKVINHLRREGNAFD